MSLSKIECVHYEDCSDFNNSKESDECSECEFYNDGIEDAIKYLNNNADELKLILQNIKAFFDAILINIANLKEQDNLKATPSGVLTMDIIQRNKAIANTKNNYACHKNKNK